MIGAVTTKVHVKREIILDPITAFENHSKKVSFYNNASEASYVYLNFSLEKFTLIGGIFL